MIGLETWCEQLLHGNRRAIAKLISRIENDQDRVTIMSQVLPRSGEKMILGITGPPGAGKSSLVEALTHLYREQQEKVGIVAVDPSSPYTGGAILGDRIRMQTHGTDPGVFIRSMGTRGHLGGVARSTGDVLKVLEAAGYEQLILETVGVGQSEIEIMEMADTVVVVLNPGTGDGIQAIKAGIMEIADIFVVNKADLPGAERLKNDIKMMLEMNGEKSWRPPIVLTNALERQGLNELREQIEVHRNYLLDSGKRVERQRKAFRQEVWRQWEEKAYAAFTATWDAWEERKKSLDEKDPYALAEKIWSKCYQNR